jgi:GPH family glycoside/pentoside/hexuronide:cation symporter
MLAGAVPLAVCFVLLWRVPDLGEGQWGLFIYYIVLSLFAFAALTALPQGRVTLPSVSDRL